MPFDYKKEYKEFYLPPKKPQILTVPAMNFAAVQGKGDPNDPAGEYKAALELLYGIAFTIKMSYKGSHKIDGYFEYVVPPLEGLWHQPGAEGVDFSNKETMAAMLEAERIAKDPNVKHYSDVEEALRELKR